MVVVKKTPVVIHRRFFEVRLLSDDLSVLARLR